MANLFWTNGFESSLVKLWQKRQHPLLVPNKNDDPWQWLLKDVLGSNLVWEGQFIRKGF
jgi:hypothetical protein